MNISSVSQQNTVILDGSKLTSQKTADKPIDLKTGSTIQGTVVSISESNGEKIATINVGDSAITAKLSEEMGLREGQTLNFAVKSNGASGTTITPLYENTSVDQSTLKALTAAGIGINNDTIQMVKDMMGAGLPINREALLDMNKNLSAFPNSSVSTMVEMKSLNIPINENNIAQFESYKNYEHQVTSAMTDIMNELPDAFNELISMGKDAQAIDMYGSVLKLFSGEEAAEGMTAEGMGAEGQTPVNPENVTVKEGEVPQAMAQAEAEVTQGEVTIVKETAEGTQGKVIIRGDFQPPQNQNPEIAENLTPQQKAELALRKALGLDQDNNSKTTVVTQQSKETQISNSFVKELRNLGVSEDTIKNYADALKESAKFTAEEAPSKEVVTRLEAAQKQLLKELSGSFDKAQLSDPAQAAAWKNIFSSQDYNKLLKNSISSQWLLKPNDVEKKENIDNLYQRLNNQVKGLTQAIEHNLGAESKLAQTANNLQNNLNFMDQLNHMFQYVQLPLQMAGQNVHGDLYVYRNKNKKMSEDGSVSAVLHLDMENLGPLDVYVKMIESKVSTNFYVADESVLDLINDNIHILNERLEKRGYSMSVKMMLHDEMDGQDAAVDEMLDVMKTPVLSTASFDARA